MTSLLITGGAGFIGTNFVRRRRAARPTDVLVVLDALTYAGDKANLDGVDDIVFIHGDIRDQALVESILADYTVNTIVNFAAESHVDRSIHGPDAFIDTNVLGTHALLKAARRVWLDTGSGRPHRFHHISTDEVFGSLEMDDPAFHEQTPYAPNSPYSATKAASDHLVRAYSRTFGLETTISNCSNNFGPYQHPEKLIPLFLINALHGRALPVYGDGQNVRDWLDVADHCAAIELILAKGRPGETYNVGGRNERRNVEVVRQICALMDRLRPAGAPHDRLITYVADRPGHDQRYAIDAAKLEAELGWRARETFETGLEKTVAWYLEHRDWWAPLREGVYGGERLGLISA